MKIQSSVPSVPRASLYSPSPLIPHKNRKMQDTLECLAAKEHAARADVGSHWDSVLSIISSAQQTAIHLWKVSIDTLRVLIDTVVSMLHSSEKPATAAKAKAAQPRTAPLPARSSSRTPAPAVAVPTTAAALPGPFAGLTILEEDVRRIYSIIHETADASLWYIPFIAQRLYSEGVIVESRVHPLKFVAEIFRPRSASDPYRSLRKDIHTIWSETLQPRWGTFMSGLAQRLQSYSVREDLTRYMPEFLRELGIVDQNRRVAITNLVREKNWEEFAATLIGTIEMSEIMPTVAARPSIPPERATTQPQPAPRLPTVPIATTEEVRDASAPSLEATADTEEAAMVATTANASAIPPLRQTEKSTLASIIAKVAHYPSVSFRGPNLSSERGIILTQWASLGSLHPLSVLAYLYSEEAIANDLRTIQARWPIIRTPFKSSLYGLLSLRNLVQIPNEEIDSFAHLFNVNADTHLPACRQAAERMNVTSKTLREMVATRDWRMLNKALLILSTPAV